MSEKDQFLKQAADLITVGNFTESARILSDGLKAFPNDTALRGQLKQTQAKMLEKVDTLIAENQCKESINLLNRWLELFPKDSKSQSLREQLSRTIKSAESELVTTKNQAQDGDSTLSHEALKFAERLVNADGMEWFNERLRLGFRVHDNHAIVTRSDRPQVYNENEICIEISEIHANYFAGCFLVGRKRLKKDDKQADLQDVASSMDLPDTDIELPEPIKIDNDIKTWTEIRGRFDSSEKLIIRFLSHKRFFWQKPSSYELIFERTLIHERQQRDKIIQQLHLAKFTGPIVMLISILIVSRISGLLSDILVYSFVVLTGILTGSPWIYRLLEPPFRNKDYKNLAIRILLSIVVVIISININRFIATIIVMAVLVTLVAVVVALALYLALGISLPSDTSHNLKVFLSLAIGNEHIPSLRLSRRGTSRNSDDVYYDNLEKTQINQEAREERIAREIEARQRGL